jgi:hypothetical protein
MTLQEAKAAYGALTDVSQMLIHGDKCTDADLLARIKTLAMIHGMTLHRLGERKIYDSLPQKVQRELDDVSDFSKYKY